MARPRKNEDLLSARITGRMTEKDKARIVKQFGGVQAFIDWALEKARKGGRNEKIHY